MGKTIAKQRNGKCVPRKTTALPENLQRLAPANPLVTCPHCQTSFRVQEGLAIARGRRCPRCERLILPEHYEQKAQELEAQITALRRISPRSIRLKNKLLALQENSTFAPANFMYGLFIKCIEALFAPAFKKTREAEVLESELARLAESEYYISDWFTFGGKPLCKGRLGPVPAYSLAARYANSKLDICPRLDSGEERGLAAEWKLFDLLDRAISQGELPADMVLCPNVFIRNPNASEAEAIRSNSWGGSTCAYQKRSNIPSALYSQIDLVAITSNAVYVFEVKSRRASISQSSTGNLSIVSDTSGKKHNGTKDQNQCAAHASALATRFPGVPFSRIFEATVYVDTSSFNVQQKGFVDNVGVFCLDRESSQDLLTALQDTEEDLSKRRGALSKKTLRKMICALRSECADVNGRKEYLHLERIETIRALERER